MCDCGNFAEIVKCLKEASAGSCWLIETSLGLRLELPSYMYAQAEDTNVKQQTTTKVSA